MSKAKRIVLPEINNVDFNEKIKEILKNCQEEINYKIIDVDYTKSVQRNLIQNNTSFRTIEEQFMSSSFSLADNIPLIPSNKIFEKIMESVEYVPFSKDISLIASNLKNINFQLIFSLIKIAFFQILRNGKNNSEFFRKILEIIDSNPVSWQDIEEYGENITFFFLYLVINSLEDTKICLSENNILRTLDAKNIFCIYNRKINMTNDGIKNFYQQMLNTNEEISLSNIPFINSETPKSEYEIFAYLIIDLRVKKTDIGISYLPINNYWSLSRTFYALFHQPTVKFLNERKHNYIYNNLYTFLNTFNTFLYSKIKPIDRIRYLLAGSVIKSAYNVRDCADVDFFVLDHEDNIEKYSRYAPKTGIPGIFDDFGKTYYANEEYYFPMIPEMYEKQKALKKREIPADTSPKNIMNNFPKFSVSGLKAGRYVDIYSAESKKIGFQINNLDDLVSDPNNRIYFMGCPIIQLKLEMIRDNIKDIDLERVSRKQLHDLHFLRHNYEYLFTRTDIAEFGLDRFRESKDKLKRNKINIGLNCYHKELISDEKVGYDLVIRRMPLYMEEITKKIIEEGPLLISKGNEIINGDCRLTYQKPLISSLPSTLLTPSKREIKVIYYYEISSIGELVVFIQPEEEIKNVSIFSDVCITGYIKVEINEGNKKISISVSGNKMQQIYAQLPGNDKKYKMILINFMKNIIQMHKIIDCHTKEKIAIDFFTAPKV